MHSFTSTNRIGMWLNFFSYYWKRNWRIQLIRSQYWLMKWHSRNFIQNRQSVSLFAMKSIKILGFFVCGYYSDLVWLRAVILNKSIEDAIQMYLYTNILTCLMTDNWMTVCFVAIVFDFMSTFLRNIVDLFTDIKTSTQHAFLMLFMYIISHFCRF